MDQDKPDGRTSAGSERERPQQRDLGRDASPSRGATGQDGFETPPIAREDAPEGPDATQDRDAWPGHYGPAYGDPTVHQGGTPPGGEAGSGSGRPSVPMQNPLPGAGSTQGNQGDQGKTGADQ